jgi:hypothetical protein
VNEAFQTFLSLSVEQRKDVFEAAAEDLDTRATYLSGAEKYFIC